MTERELNEAQLKLAQRKSELEHKRFRSEVLMMAQEAIKQSAGTPGVYTVDPDKAIETAKKYMDFISDTSSTASTTSTPVLKLVE